MSVPAIVGVEGAEPRSMSMLGLVKEFKTVHETMPNRSFCFILGAGASVTSKIKSAGDMVKDWIHTLHRRVVSHKGAVPDDWATDETLGITGFDPKDPAASYSALYRRMYEHDPDAGYAYLEAQMKGAEPSYGYSVLGRILAEHRHRVVITVNFDNLVADSVTLFSMTYPLVCGHELLASFVSDKLRRPLVLKVHRDLLLGPMSTPEEIQKIDKGFSEAINRLLKNYTPIVIGYGGNDGSLMSCLEKLMDPIPGGIYWCYRDGSVPPSERIKNVVARHNGCLVSIMGFDELLMQFGNELEYKAKAAGEYVLKRGRERSKQIVKQAQELEERIEKRIEESLRSAMIRPAPGKIATTKAANDAVAEAMSDTMQRSDKGKRWWQWVDEANSEPDLAKREEIYRRAITENPRTRGLLNNYALFLADDRKDYDASEMMYKKALEVDPKYANTLSNYAIFLTQIRKEYNTAEAMHKRAIEADPNHAPAFGNYANFLLVVRKDFDTAERMYKRAIEADHKFANAMSNYGVLLAEVRKDFDAAEAMHKRAIEADPKNANHYGNLAKLYFDTDRVADGLKYLNEATANFRSSEPSVGCMECWMYAYCVWPKRKQAEALSQLKTLLLQTDIRTGEWNYSGVIAVAKRKKHSEFNWLGKLAEVVAGRAKPTSLDKWSAWKKSLVSDPKTTAKT